MPIQGVNDIMVAARRISAESGMPQNRAFLQALKNTRPDLYKELNKSSYDCYWLKRKLPMAQQFVEFLWQKPVVTWRVRRKRRRCVLYSVSATQCRVRVGKKSTIINMSWQDVLYYVRERYVINELAGYSAIPGTLRTFQLEKEVSEKKPFGKWTTI